VTAQDYVQYIAQNFRDGKLYTEIPTNEPRNLSYRIRRSAQGLGWHFQALDESLIITPKSARTTRTPEPKQEELFVSLRPDCGPRCQKCGETLYPYEVKFKECLKHRKETQ
jgi:hypothetical protein